MVVPGSHGCLPDLTLLQLTVAQHGVDVVVPAVHLAGLGHADRDRDAVAQGAGVHLNAGYLVVRVADEARAVGAVGVHELGLVEVAAVGEDAVERLHRVALREHEAVPVRVGLVFRGAVQVFVVERDKRLDLAHVAADVAAAGLVYEGHDVRADIAGLLLKLSKRHAHSPLR